MPCPKVRNWSADERADAAKVAPDRYNSSDWHKVYGVPQIHAVAWRDFVAAATYQPGDVIWVEKYTKHGPRANKARIVHVYPDRDRYGDRREMFGVQLMTGKGIWSKTIQKTWPGYIERGYKLAAEGVTVY